jgi:hypothetical protein
MRCSELQVGDKVITTAPNPLYDQVPLGTIGIVFHTSCDGGDPTMFDARFPTNPGIKCIKFSGAKVLRRKP